jgi:hypothetical protein
MCSFIAYAILALSIAALPPRAEPSSVGREGTVMDIGECTVGVSSVEPESAWISTFKRDDPGAFVARQEVKPGQFLVACDALYEVVGVHPDQNREQKPRGWIGGGGMVVFDLRPAKSPVVTRGSVILTLGGTVDRPGPPTIAMHALDLRKVNGALTARFIVRVGETETSVTARAGQVVAIGTRPHRIVSILPRNDSTGVPGWVELVPVGAR